MCFNEEFEDETGIDEDYDPYFDRESGYLSVAYKDKYIDWLEKRLLSVSIKDKVLKKEPENKFFYLSGVVFDNPNSLYGDSFEKIIEALSENEAKEILKLKFYCDDIRIDSLYETSSDAQI